MTQPTGRAPRSDARENRARILTAARAVLAGDPSAPLQSVARAAGVGQGTMYRHFPGREALLVAVHQEELNALTDKAVVLLATYEPLEALRLWFEHLIGHGRSGHGAAVAVEAAARAGGGRDRPPAVAALDLLLKAGKEARQVRSDAEAEDVLMLGTCLLRAENRPAWRERHLRMLTVIIDGLRADPTRER
ncbi:helix-turn-helix domain containing protein [Streptomyces sp. AD681]|uniref:TetR/AcrR family transcriptional regulator n=1 Tax=Streptomyces sp. AD681 TaxID=3019069 RepID=UPI0022F1955B|nr:TetR/AcrR family transcriptional regulator [Streptomyces sp. AD681]MDA5146287.1 helix-turn-helix domain containing protein [Streptomyces sp. AD681]